MNIPFLDKLKDRFSKERFSIGLDLGTSAIKMVKLKFSGANIELAGLRIESVTDNPETSLKKIKELEKITQANIAVSGPNTVIRDIQFPLMPKDEVTQSLRFEAEKHIPFSINEVYLDSHILKEDLADNKMQVLAVAAKKDFINQRLKLIESAGIKPNILDMDSIALINAFNRSKVINTAERNAAALLNIGASQTNLNILENGVPFLSRDIPIAGNNFTKNIAGQLGLDFKAAEEVKVNPAIDKKEKVGQAVESILINLAAEIRVSFDYYESRSAVSIAKIFLSGGGSLFSGLKESLNKLLDIEVDYWDPLKSIIISGTIEQAGLEALAKQLAIAVGLALRR